MANQLLKKFIGNDQVDGSKILLDNNQYFRVKLQDGSVKNLFKVDGTDKLQLSDAPIITNPGTDGSSVQTKDQLESAVAAEAALRVAGDSALGTEIDAVETNLAQEVTDRTNAVAAEATAREAADDVLDGKIDQEISDRAAADTAKLAEAKAYADQKIADLIDSAPGTLDTLKEIADQLAADESAVTALTSTVASQGGRITTLEGEMDTAQADLDAVEDRVTDVEGRASAIEAKDIAQDAELADHESRLDSLESAVPAWNDKKITLVSGDITAGYVDLDHVVVPKSIVARVDRLAIHEGAAEDFVVSTVGGKSRITFVNGMVSPSAEALSVGDNLYFKYQF